VNTAAVIVIILILLVAVVLGVVLARRRRSTQLQEQFGPEYERSVSAASGDRRAAETALQERRQRREEFDVRDLSPEERTRFRDSWNEIQRGFVDDPRQSLHSADLFVAEIMRARGYPADDDFDRRADDLSVDHPRVVQHYREARRVRDSGGEVDTENQRTAFTSYRALVDALLGDDEAHVSGTRTASDTAPTPTDRTTDHTTDRTDQVGTDRTDHVGTDHTDADAVGRHALRDGDAAPGTDRPAERPADPSGAQSPRTEERTR
jgi:hypothetical protein